MRLYSFIFLPALLFAIFSYNYLPLALSPEQSAVPLLVFDEGNNVRTYIVSTSDKAARVDTKRFFDAGGKEIGYIKYSYYKDGIVKSKTYFAYELSKAKTVRQVLYSYDRNKNLRDALVTDNSKTFYISYDKVNIQGGSYQLEERWYATKRKENIIQVKRQTHDRANILIKEEYYKSSQSIANELIYYKTFLYDKRTNRLDYIRYYDAKNRQIKLLKYEYNGGSIDSISIRREMMSFKHEALDISERQQIATKISFLSSVDSGNFPRSVVAAFGGDTAGGYTGSVDLEKLEQIPAEEPLVAKEPIKNGISSWFLKLRSGITTKLLELPSSEIVLGLEPNILAKVSTKEKRFIWRRRVDSRVINGPAPVGDSGRIVVGTEEGTLYCVDFSGLVLWKIDFGDFLEGSSLLIRQNIVYAQRSNLKVVALSIRTGEALWTFDPKGRNPDYVSSLFSSEENVLLAIDNVVYAFDPYTGDVWTYIDDNKIISQPIVHNDTVFLSFENGIAAFSIGRAIFKEMWSLPDMAVTAKPYLLNRDGTLALYVLVDQGFVVKIDISKGRVVWKTRINIAHNVLLSGAGQYIYANPFKDFFVVLDDAKGTIEGVYKAVDKKSREKDQIVTPIIISKDNKSQLLYGTKSGKLFNVYYNKR